MSSGLNNCLIREDSGDSWAEYSYDLAGNRTAVISVAGGGDPGSTNLYTTGTGNRLDSITAEGAEIQSFEYNAAGCLVSNLTVSTSSTNLTTFAWDERYRLEEVQITNGTNLANTISYTYDVLGRRTLRLVVPPSGGSPLQEEHYIYNGNQVAADLDSSGDVIRSYTWGPGIDNLLAMTVYSISTGSTNLTASTLYPIKDHQNSVLAFTDASGTIVETYEYDAYGDTKVFNASGTELTESAIGNRYMWQGREYDAETGLYYFRARWYNPQTGRWLSKDPIGISGGLNLYVFCGNNPVNFIDPNGLFVESEALGPIGIAVGVGIHVGRLHAGSVNDAADQLTGFGRENGIDISTNITRAFDVLFRHFGVMGPNERSTIRVYMDEDGNIRQDWRNDKGKCGGNVT